MREHFSCPRPAAAVLTLLLAALSAAPGTAQEAGEEPAPAEDFFEIVDVEIVNIDVWVSDKDGQPVDGLGREDFIVYRDGEPVELTNFYAVASGRPVTAREEPSPTPATEPETRATLEFREIDPNQVAPEHRLWLVVYIDNFNIDPVERDRVMPAIRRFLGDNLRAGDRAMIVTYDRSLKVRQPFTDNLPVLFGRLQEIEDETGFAVIRRRERAETLEQIDDEDSMSAALLTARRYAEQLMNGVQYSVDNLERLIGSLGGLPGRKAVLHVSSGIPMLAGEEAFHAVGVKFNASEAYGEIPRHDTTRSFERVNRHANAHRVVFYTLDAGGLRGFEYSGAEYAGFVNPRLRTTLDSVVPENLQSPLRLMALETGGRAIVNRNEVLPALEEVATDFRSFYSLGISSSSADSGSYHEIEVKLRDGLDHRLRHRAGYRSKNAETRMREGLRSALLYTHQSNPLGLTVTWGTPEPYDDGDQYLMPIQLRIPLKDLVLLPLGEKHELRLRLYVGVVGDTGEISDIDSSPLGLRLQPEHVEAARKESLVHSHKILLSAGRKKVGVSVLDQFGRQSATVTRYVQAGPKGN